MGNPIALRWAMKQRCDSAAEKAVLLVVADIAAEKVECYPGQDRIAQDACCSTKSVERALRAFEDRGWIVRARRFRKNGSRTSDRIIFLKVGQAAEPTDTMSDSQTDTMSDGEVDQQTSCPRPPDTVSPPTTFECPVERQGEERARMRALPSQEDQDRFWSAYLPVGRVNFARSNLGIAMGRHVARLGSVERLIGAAKAYSAEIERHKSIPLSLARWLADPNLVDQYDPTESASSPDTRWLSLVRHFKRRADWQGEGPPPGQPGCMVPAHILEAEGYPPEPRLKVVGGAS